MPQVFQVLRCYKCLTFQVHQVKKSNKWECKLCGEKQSIKRHYGIGTGKECRHHVQRLNELRGETTGNSLTNLSNSRDSDGGSEEEPVKSDKLSSNKGSKWSSYVEKEEPNKSSNDGKESLFGKEVVLEIPKKRKKAFNKYCRNKKNKKYQSEDNDLEGEIDCNTLDVVPCKKPVKRFVPPVTNSTSKWADYDEKLQNTDPDANAIKYKQNDILVCKRSREVSFESTFNSVNQDYDIDVSSDRNSLDSNKVMKETKPLVFCKDLKESDKRISNKTVSTLKQNSKWTDFIDSCENEEDNGHDNVENIPHNIQVNASNIFSMCDDNELDSILEI